MAIDRSLLFTIIMPAFNVDAYIEDAIHDVLEQSWSNWNLIIVDDCSTDQTGMIADAYADADTRIRVMHHETNQGVSAARNTGLQEADGDYVLFLDPDDRYDLDLLATVADAVHRLPADIIVWSLEQDYYTPRGRIEWNEVQYLATAFYDCRHPLRGDQETLEPQIRQWDSTRPRRQMKKAQIDALGLDARHNLEIGHCTGFMTDIFDMQDAVDDLSEQSLLALLGNKAYRREFIEKNSIKFGEDSPSEDEAFNIAVTEQMTSLATLEDVLCGISIRREKGFGNFLRVQKMKIHDLKTGSGLGVN